MRRQWLEEHLSLLEMRPDGSFVVGHVGRLAPEKNLRFLGAAGTVTGSRYQVDVVGRTVLIDCGTALAELSDGINISGSRCRWASIVTLLRAVGHALLQLAVLLLHLVVQRLDAQERPEARRQFHRVKRLCNEIVGPGGGAADAGDTCCGSEACSPTGQNASPTWHTSAGQSSKPSDVSTRTA